MPLHPPALSGVHAAVIRHTASVTGIHSRKYALCQVTACRTLTISPGVWETHQIWAAYTTDTNIQNAATARQGIAPFSGMRSYGNAGDGRPRHRAIATHCTGG